MGRKEPSPVNGVHFPGEPADNHPSSRLLEVRYTFGARARQKKWIGWVIPDGMNTVYEGELVDGARTFTHEQAEEFRELGGLIVKPLISETGDILDNPEEIDSTQRFIAGVVLPRIQHEG